MTAARDSEPEGETQPWILLAVVADPTLVEKLRTAVHGVKFFTREVEVRVADSALQAESVVAGCEPARCAMVLVDLDLVSDRSNLGIETLLRGRFGDELQVVLYTGDVQVPTAGTGAFRDVSRPCVSRQDATPDCLRDIVENAIRTFRTFSTKWVVSDGLSHFVSLLETATTLPALDQRLHQALSQYASAWQFRYLFVPDLGDQVFGAGLQPWEEAAVMQLRMLEPRAQRSVSFFKLSPIAGFETFGSIIRPLTGGFSAAFAFCRAEPPSAVLGRELRILLRAWALTQESLRLKELEEQKVRDEIQGARLEAIAQVVADVVHDASTPLDVATTAASVIREMLGQDNFRGLTKHPAFREDLEALLSSASLIEANIRRAHDLVRAVKQFSVRQLAEEIEDLDLARCVQDVLHLYSPRAKRAGLDIRLHDKLDPHCRRWQGYAGYLPRVVLNLVGNVERYAYPDGHGGKVDITIESNPERDGFSIEVRDFGVGIPPENLPKIFERFFTTGRERGGTGLGLFIVQKIVSSIFGGTVSVQSEPGKGAAFTIRLPLQAPVRTAQRPERAGHDVHQFAQDYIELLRRLLQRSLTADEQLRMAEAKGVLDNYVAQSQGLIPVTQRRRFMRIPTFREVPVYKDGSEIRTRLWNLSESGAMHIFAEEMAKGVRLQILYFDEPDFAVRGEVVSCVPWREDDAEEPVWRVGIAFEHLEGPTLKHLKGLIGELISEYWQ